MTVQVAAQAERTVMVVDTWLITLILVVVVAVALVAVVATSRARRRREANAIGLPPIGALAGDEPAAVEPEPVGDQESTGPRRAAAGDPAR